MRLRAYKNVFNCTLYHALWAILSRLSHYKDLCKPSSAMMLHSCMCFVAFSAFNIHFSVETSSWKWLTPDNVSEALFGPPTSELTLLTINLNLIVSTIAIVTAVMIALHLASHFNLCSKLMMIYRYWTALGFATQLSGLSGQNQKPSTSFASPSDKQRSKEHPSKTPEHKRPDTTNQAMFSHT